jgi:hypothetical protein
MDANKELVEILDRLGNSLYALRTTVQNMKRKIERLDDKQQQPPDESSEGPEYLPPRRANTPRNVAIRQFLWKFHANPIAKKKKRKRKTKEATSPKARGRFSMGREEEDNPPPPPDEQTDPVSPPSPPPPPSFPDLPAPENWSHWPDFLRSLVTTKPPLAPPLIPTCSFCCVNPGVHFETKWNCHTAQNEPAGYLCSSCKKKGIVYAL